MDKLEIKAQFTVSDAGEITGIAWPFGSPDSVGDVIHKGAFALSAGLPILFEHDPEQVVGNWESVAETETGLEAKGRLFLDGVPRAREVYARIKSGRANGLSIGFRAGETKARPGGGRDILSLHVAEISVVANPSHPAARILTVKSKEHDMPNENTAPVPEFAELEKKVAAVVDEVKTFAKVADRLDKIEAKFNRPAAPANDNDPSEGRKAFASYLRHGHDAMPELERKALVAANDKLGGYLAPSEFQAEVDKNIVEISPVRQVARVSSTTAGEVILPKRDGTPTGSWVGETEDRSATGSTYGQTEVPIYEMATSVDVSLKLLEDSAVNIETEVAFDLAEEFGRMEGFALVKGDGSKKPLGFVNGGLSYTPSGNASTLGTNPADLLITHLYSLKAAYRNRGVWMMNGSTLAAIRKLKDGTTGTYLWQPAYAAGQPETILGRPVIEAPDMDDIAANAVPIAFGDFTAGYRVFDRVGMSIFADPYTQRTNGLVRFHARRRVGGAVRRPEAIKLIKCATA